MQTLVASPKRKCCWENCQGEENGKTDVEQLSPNWFWHGAPEEKEIYIYELYAYEKIKTLAQFGMFYIPSICRKTKRHQSARKMWQKICSLCGLRFHLQIALWVPYNSVKSIKIRNIKPYKSGLGGFKT